jgi:hypothetical protein
VTSDFKHISRFAQLRQINVTNVKPRLNVKLAAWLEAENGQLDRYLLSAIANPKMARLGN